MELKWLDVDTFVINFSERLHCLDFEGVFRKVGKYGEIIWNSLGKPKIYDNSQHSRP